MTHFDIFISYSSKDKAVADQVVAHIEKAGYTCWVAPRNIEGGAEYSEVIEKAILECQVFLLIFSENSAQSSWVKSELNIAFSENKYLVPYKIDATPLKGTMRLLLNDKHWIEKNNDENKQMNLLLSAIQKYFAMQEKGGTDNIENNSYYANIFKRKKRKQLFLSLAIACLLVVVGAVVFNIASSSNKKHSKQYQDAIERAFSIEGNSVDDIITKRNLLLTAQKIENEVPVSQRQDLSSILVQLNFKLDSIYVINIKNARIYAQPETQRGDNKAIECYKLALQVKEDTAISNELKMILARKDNYE